MGWGESKRKICWWERKSKSLAFVQGRLRVNLIYQELLSRAVLNRCGADACCEQDTVTALGAYCRPERRHTEYWDDGYQVS